MVWTALERRKVRSVRGWCGPHWNDARCVQYVDGGGPPLERRKVRSLREGDQVSNIHAYKEATDGAGDFSVPD
jgi:hypothetical protein